jgi:hypothetical protein
MRNVVKMSSHNLLEHNFLQRLNGRGSSTYSSIVLFELCPCLDLAICQCPPHTTPNEQVHQACRAHPVSGRSNQSRSWPWRNPWSDSHLSRPADYNEHMQRVTSLSLRVRVQLVVHQYQNTWENATNYDPVCGWMRLHPYLVVRVSCDGDLRSVWEHIRSSACLDYPTCDTVIINPHGVSSEDPLKDTYPLH